MHTTIDANVALLLILAFAVAVLAIVYVFLQTEYKKGQVKKMNKKMKQFFDHR